MTKEQAATILDVGTDATLDQVRKKFEVTYSDYQIRLSNAPTPSLKKTFQERLKELQTAAEVLHPGVTSKHEDLPGTSPVAGIPVASSKPSTPVAARPPQPSPPAGLPASARIAILVAIVFAAISSFTTVRWLNSQALIGQLRGSYEQQVGALSQLEGQSRQLQDRLSLLKNARIKVQNAGSDPMTITWVGAIFITPDGGLGKFDSAFFGYPTWTIRPGSSVQLEQVEGASVRWNGDAVFYSLDVKIGNDEYNVVGAVKEFVDGTLKLRFE